MCMTHRHARKCISARRSPPFINLEDSDIISIIENHVRAIRERLQLSHKQIAFSVGIDATVLVKTFQYSSQLHAIIGGVYPNNCINVAGKSSNELNAIMKDCLDGKFGTVADEVKVAVVSFQDTPVGMCPYLVLAGNAQTVNERNDFGKRIMKLCQQASQSVGNCVVLNQSTDGVSCEVECNKQTILDFLSGTSNVCALPDPNHNAKNGRYQQFGGSCAAVIGHYVIDPWLLLDAGVAHELVRPQDYASDSVVLRLFSYDSVKRVIHKDSPDAGNVGVLIVTMVMTRMRLYAVNAKSKSWRVRAVMSYMSTVWFLCFQTSGNKDNPHTMLPNKRNMLLETLSLLFLVTGSDVLQPRRMTSEANKHTHGCWHVLQSDFNLEQLVRIVDKSKNSFRGHL